MNIDIVDKVKDIIEDTMFENHVFIAGGAVRDALLNRKTKDIDFVIDLPYGGVGFAEWITRKTDTHKKGTNPVIFPRFGTANFRIWNEEFESVMSRKESYQAKDRNPKVEFGTLDEDVFRRDFTINSLLFDVSNNKLLDITKMGISDLNSRIIRTTSEPSSIFKEDPLRMLRAIRFSCQLGFKIEEKTEKALHTESLQLKYISKERIQSELSKILLSKNAGRGVYSLLVTGLMKNIIPELYHTINLEQNKYHFGTVLEHTLMALDLAPLDLTVRLAVLLHDIGKIKTAELNEETGENSFINHEIVGSHMAEDILKFLKFPNNIRKDVSFIIKNHMFTKGWGDDVSVKDKSIRKLRVRLGTLLPETLEVIHADNLSHAEGFCLPNQVPNILERIENLKERKEPATLPINGNDVMEFFNIKPGKEVGNILEKAELLFLENPHITKEEMLNSLKV